MAGAVNRRDDTGSLPLVMLLAVVGMGLSVVLASIIAVQTSQARWAAQLPRALDAAEAGLDVAMARIRAAVSAAGEGDRTLLPCGPFTDGAVGGTRESTYRVTIGYRTVGGTAITCATGAGAASTPTSADLVSIGTDSITGVRRTLSASYEFSTTNQNVAGGLVHIYHDRADAGAADLCLGAGSATPAAGTPLQAQTCRAGDAQQQFAYGDTLYLYLPSSVTDAQPLGMCVDGGAVPHATDGTPVTFQPCTATVSARLQWSFNDHANFEGTSNGAKTDNYCLTVESPNVPGSGIVIMKGNAYCKTNSSNVHTMTPEADVGAGGAARSDSPQVVNFAEFGRCIDVTNKDVTWGYLIVWPCKQAPDPTLVTWNQRWDIPPVPTGQTGVTGWIRTTSPAGTYCLSSPMTATRGSYPVPIDCPSGTPAAGAATTWTIHGDTGDYPTSYTIVDSAGHCLAATDPNAADRDMFSGGQNTSKVIVEACAGSTLEKWDAPPNIVNPTPLRDIREH